MAVDERTEHPVDAELGEHDDDERPLLPPAVAAAKKDEQLSKEEDFDATAWLLESGPTPDEVEPTVIRLNVGTQTKPKMILWKIVPLPDAEFKKFRRLVTGNRRTRRAIAQGDVMSIDDWRYHCLVVAAATVEPDLRAVAVQKRVADPADVVAHRFQAKPGLVNYLSGYVSDISGYDEGDLEIVAGNS